MPPDKEGKKEDEETKDLNVLKEQYKNCMRTANTFKALMVLDKITMICIENNDDVACNNAAQNCINFLSPELRYENLVNQYQARRLNDVTHFYMWTEMRKRAFHQAYAPSRTFLTPHRRRQLAKTSNYETRIFSFGINGLNCLAVPSPSSANIELPTQIKIPPVYEMRMSTVHTVFWLHDGRFVAAGDARNFLIKLKSRVEPVLYATPKELDFQIKKGETVTGFKALENGTLLETNKRWYFIGDYPRARDYLKTLHSAHFELAPDIVPPHESFWVSSSRPSVSCMAPKLDDVKNIVPVKILNTSYMIKVFPSYWTELNPGHVKRRPVCFLVEGVEVKDVRIDNIASNDVLWAVHDDILYHGSMWPMMKEDNDGDERNLDNYIMLIELSEYQTPSPIRCTGVQANNNFGMMFKCGDYPDQKYDFLEILENRYRGKHIQRMMFETIETYQKYGPNHDGYTVKQRLEVGEYDYDTLTSIDILIAEANTAYRSVQMTMPLKMDWLGRIEKEYRWANFYGLLAYISRPRLPNQPPKCFYGDIDSEIRDRDPVVVARHRMKSLCEEFERVNYPGTDVWKPTAFLRQHPEPVEDKSSEGEYRVAAVRWAMREFGRNIKAYKASELHRPDDTVNQLIIQYIMHTIWFAQDLTKVIYKSVDPPRPPDTVTKFLDSIDNTVPDSELLYPSMNPGEIFKNRLKRGILDFHDLDEKMDVKVTFLMEHRDPSLRPTRFTIMTCPLLLSAQNSHLLKYMDENKVVDLNKVYPNDKKLHRLIVQTHFYTHGFTDAEGFIQHEVNSFVPLGYRFYPVQQYLKRNRPRFRGFLTQVPDFPKIQLVGLKPASQKDIPLETNDGTFVYCNRLLRALYSEMPRGESLPNTLSANLMLIALVGLYDRRVFEPFRITERVEICRWYKEAKMFEALYDLLKMNVLDARVDDVREIRSLVRDYPTWMERLIAQYRPAMLLWYRTPVPKPRIRHVQVIMEMFPKNEFDRNTRVPRKQLTNKDGTVEDSVFQQIGTRELRKWFTSEEERRCPRFANSLQHDFPIDYPYKPFKPNCEKVEAIPRIGGRAPIMIDNQRLKTLSLNTTTPAPPIEKTQRELKEEQLKAYRQELQRLADDRASHGSRVKKNKKYRKK